MAGKATQQLTPGRGEPGLAPRLADPITGARLETCSPSRRRMTITPWVARPERLMPSTGVRIMVPPSEISITW